MEKYTFYLINQRFKNIFRGELLKVFYSLELSKDENEVNSNQFNLFVEEINVTGVKNLIINKFSNHKNFSYVDRVFKLNNALTGEYEVLIIEAKSIILNHCTKNSNFLDFLALYYPNLIKIDHTNSNIMSMSLVKPLNLR